MKTPRALLLQQAFRMAAAASAARIALHRHRPDPGHICIVTAYTPEIASYGDLGVANKSAYARRHGYHFRAATSGFVADRPASWSKIRFIAEALRDYEWVFWSDADALIMNGAIPLESFLPHGYDIHLSRASSPFLHINAGHMFFRSGPFSRLFLRAAWQLTAFVHDSTWEQRAINHLCERYSLRRLVISPNRAFNSFAGILNDPMPFQPGDFIVHFPGASNKLALMQHYARQAS